MTTEIAEPRPLVRAQGVRKSFGNNEVLKGIDLRRSGAVRWSAIGASGSGKSYLPAVQNHLEKIDGGLLRVEGLAWWEPAKGPQAARAASTTRSAPNRSDIGMVFQHFNLFPHLTVLENLMEAPLRVFKERKAEAGVGALGTPGKGGAGREGTAYPRHLSGGQQQRVAIARALGMNRN